MSGILVGGGYKPSYNVVIKAQYSNYFVKDATMPIMIDENLPPLEADMELDAKVWTLAVSILF